MPGTPNDRHGARTLPGHYFTSRTLFVEESERIFRRHWLFVAPAARLAAAREYLAVEVEGESILLVRDRDGSVRAFFNVCRHRGAQLCEATGHGRFEGAIVCPYHAWSYDLDGRLRAAPHLERAAGRSPADLRLAELPVALWEGLLFVHLGEPPRPLAAELAPLTRRAAAWRIPELVVAHCVEYDVRANWKLLFQNYSECYHCPKLHPLLNRLTPYRQSSNDLEDGPVLGGPMELARSGSLTVSGRRCGAPLPGLSDADLQRVYYYTLFPSLFLSLHPDYVLLHRLARRAPDETHVVCYWLCPPAALVGPDSDLSGAVEFWHMTNEQDWRICESTQRGVTSAAYAPGPYSDLEGLLAASDRHYLSCMGEGDGDPER